jgi:hypothetical protein
VVGKVSKETAAAGNVLGESSASGGYFYRRNFSKTVADLAAGAVNRDADAPEGPDGERIKVDHQHKQQQKKPKVQVAAETEPASAFMRRFHVNLPASQGAKMTKDEQHYQHQVQYLQARMKRR